MKNYIIGIALALALVMGVAAFAETAEPATDSIPAVTEEAPNEGAAPEAPAAETEKTDDNASLQEALEAYRSARESKSVDDLAEELNGYLLHDDGGLAVHHRHALAHSAGIAGSTDAQLLG